MEANVRLYRPVKVIGQSFNGIKRQTVPNQSMSLKEILRRFVKREQLPIARQGIYEERFGDLEKLSKADVTEQMERVEEIKADIAAYELRYQQRKAKVKADMEAAAREAIVPPVGGEPIKPPPDRGVTGKV